MYTTLGVIGVIIMLLVIMYVGPWFYYKLIEQINADIVGDGIILLMNAFEGGEYPEAIECMLSRLNLLADGQIPIVSHLGDRIGHMLPEAEMGLEREVFLIRKYHTLHYELDKKMFPVWLAGEMANSYACSAGKVEKDTVEEYQSLLYCGEVLILVYQRLRDIGYDFDDHPDVENLEEELFHYQFDRNTWLMRFSAKLVHNYPRLALAIAEVLS